MGVLGGGIIGKRVNFGSFFELNENTYNRIITPYLASNFAPSPHFWLAD